MKHARITVRGPSIFEPPICETDKARIIEVRDGFGDLMALLVRILDPEGDVWGLVGKDDEDWSAALIRYGYVNPGVVTLDDIATRK